MTDPIAWLLSLYDEVWLHDYEFIAEPGERQDVVCLAAYEVRSGRTLRLWRDQLESDPPYRTDACVLFVNFVGNAECGCHLALGWPLPKNVLDLSPAFRNLVNGRQTPDGKGLLGALRYFGFDTIDQKRKDAMRDRIMEGWPFTDDEKKQILEYCHGDVEDLLRLLPKMLEQPDFDLGVALYHGEFAAVSALMEYHGVPIDMEIFTQLADKNTWRMVRDVMVPKIDAQYGVYVRSAGGDWSFNNNLFEAYLKREGILAGWPRNENDKLIMKSKVFESMSKNCPQLEDLRQLRHARNKMRKVKLAVGNGGRNRTVLWPFKSKTSRTQPKAAQWIFSPAVWLRSLIKPESGMAVAYIDYSSMEFLIAAALSDGHCGSVNTMLNMYRSGDPYLAFAKKVGAIPAHITKQTLGDYADVRESYKNMLLAVQYGMHAETLAARLNVSTFEAHEMLAQHRELFYQYWSWSNDWLQHSLQTGTMSTAFGWTCHTGILELSELSIRNWPVQATGADILRVACIMAARHGIKLVAPVHDAVMIEAPIDRIEADVTLMQDIMRRASRVVLGVDTNGAAIELRTDAKIVRYPERYRDKRGKRVWDEVMDLLSVMKTRQEVA